MMDALFESMVAGSGQAYLDAERKLRDSGALAEPTLRKNLNNPDPIARLLARTTLDWLEGSAQDYEAVLEYLLYIQNRMALTPAGSPPPLGVANYLSLHFATRAVDFLAAGLVKSTDWPHWKVVAVLFYLKQQARPSASETLLRFATETSNESWRGLAIEAIEATRDPDIKAKVAFERQAEAARGKQLPPALEALAAPRP